MATEAFVLINVSIGREDDLIAKIKEIEEVVEAFVVMGSYDIIAKLRLEEAKELKPLVTNKIRALPGIRETITIIVV